MSLLFFCSPDQSDRAPISVFVFSIFFFLSNVFFFCSPLNTRLTLTLSHSHTLTSPASRFDCARGLMLLCASISVFSPLARQKPPTKKKKKKPNQIQWKPLSWQPTNHCDDNDKRQRGKQHSEGSAATCSSAATLLGTAGSARWIAPACSAMPASGARTTPAIR